MLSFVCLQFQASLNKLRDNDLKFAGGEQKKKRKQTKKQNPPKETKHPVPCSAPSHPTAPPPKSEQILPLVL